MNGAAESIAVREIGSFHFGGRNVTLSGLPMRRLPIPGLPGVLEIEQNGEYTVEQSYVQYVRLVNPSAKYPLLMLHGGGLTGASWESTPDGRPGWQSYFLKHGHETYIVDQLERGRSGFAPPQVWPEEAIFPNASFTWELCRMGPPGSFRADSALRIPFPGSQFPTHAFEGLMRQRVPYWGAAHQTAAQAAYDSLVRRIGPCVIMSHSSGGQYAFRTALNCPDLVRAVIAIEPAGAADSLTHQAAPLKEVPHLFLWGDNIESDPVQKRATSINRQWYQRLRDAGVRAEWIDLPERGITGNSHMIMMDLNNGHVADLVQHWMHEADLMND